MQPIPCPFFLTGIKEEGRGKKRSNMPWIPAGSMGFTAGTFPLQIRQCFGTLALPTFPQDLLDNVVETHRRRISFVLAFVLSSPPPSTNPSVLRCGCFFVRYSSNLITEALKFPWIMAECALQSLQLFIQIKDSFHISQCSTPRLPDWE